MTLKLGTNLTNNYSINFDPKKRDKNKLLFIIVHYTGMKNESKAIERLCSSKSKVSAHYFIKYSGEILNLVPDLYTAWHAGESFWKKFKSLNKYSIGIEISNPGHDNGYRKFSSKQIISIMKLLKYLMKKYNIEKQNILAHSDIAPDRKKDPGEKFPWKALSKIKLAYWHKLNEKKLKKQRLIKLTLNEKNEFFRNLYKLGYNRLKKDELNNGRKILVTAFQRRFRQDLINGKLDQECLLIIKNLV